MMFLATAVTIVILAIMAITVANRLGSSCVGRSSGPAIGTSLKIAGC
jgi:hypothetical protein